MPTTTTLPSEVRAALDEIKRALVGLYRERLSGIYLYGSYARGDFTADSDVDLMVVLSGPVQTGKEISRINPTVSAACLRHDLLISTFPVALEVFENSDTPLLGNVRREAVAI